MYSLPFHFPDCLEIGARPASFAACLPLNFPSSRMSVRGAQAVTLAMPLLPTADAGPESWSLRDKFAAVLETATLKEADLAEYCRKHGLYPA
jgi:hypothetical protein